MNKQEKEESSGGSSELEVMYASEDGIEMYIFDKKKKKKSSSNSLNNRTSKLSNNITTPESSVSFQERDKAYNDNDDEEEDTPLSASTNIDFSVVDFSPFAKPESLMSDTPRQPESFDLLFSEEKENEKNELTKNIPISIQHPTPSNISNISQIFLETNEQQQQQQEEDEENVNKKLFLQQDFNSTNNDEENENDNDNDQLESNLRIENQRLYEEILKKDLSLQTMTEKLRKVREEKKEYMFKFNREHRKLLDERMKYSKKINELLRQETEIVSENEILRQSEEKYKKIIRFLKTRESQYQSIMNDKENKIQEQTQTISILKQDLTDLNEYKTIVLSTTTTTEEEMGRNDESQEDILPLVHRHQKTTQNNDNNNNNNNIPFISNIRKHIPPVNSRIPKGMKEEEEEEGNISNNNNNDDKRAMTFKNEFLNLENNNNINLSIMSNISSIKFLDDEMQEMLQETTEIIDEENQQHHQQEEEEEEEDSELLEYERLTSMIESAPAVDPRTFLEQQKIQKEADQNIEFNRWSF